MKAITSVSTIFLISMLIFVFTGCLRTSPLCLRMCVCTHILSRVCLSEGLSDILCMFSLGLSVMSDSLSSYLAVSPLWMSV